jgi:hypothetical protein
VGALEPQFATEQSASGDDGPEELINTALWVVGFFGQRLIMMVVVVSELPN